MINSTGDGLPLLVILNLLRIEFLFVKGKNFAEDDLLVTTCLGITLLAFCGDKPLSSAGNDPLNSAGEIYFCTPLGINFQSLLGTILQLH